VGIYALSVVIIRDNEKGHPIFMDAMPPDTALAMQTVVDLANIGAAVEKKKGKRK